MMAYLLENLRNLPSFPSAPLLLNEGRRLQVFVFFEKDHKVPFYLQVVGIQITFTGFCAVFRMECLLGLDLS